MKICPNCQTKYETGNFCENCGTKLQEEVQELHCPNCGIIVNESSKFCPECGSSLSKEVVPKDNKIDERIEEFYDLETLVSLERKTHKPKYKLELGLRFLHGKGVTRDVFRAFKLINEAYNLNQYDDNNDHKIHYTLGTCYLYGWGTNRDLDKAFNHYTIAEKLGNNDAHTYLKNYRDYEKAWGILFNSKSSNKEEGFEILKRSADNRCEEAYLWVAICYEDGIGCKKSDALAIYWLEKAFEYDMSDSMVRHKLGKRYLLGQGVSKDEIQAYKLFKGSSDEHGKFWLAYCRLFGFGCEKKVKAAFNDFSYIVKYTENSPLLKDVSMYFLGKCYELGLGTEVNLLKAESLYNSMLLFTYNFVDSGQWKYEKSI